MAKCSNFTEGEITATAVPISIHLNQAQGYKSVTEYIQVMTVSELPGAYSGNKIQTTSLMLSNSQ